MKKKILITCPSIGIGGVEKAFLGFVNSFDTSLYQIDILLINKKGVLFEYLSKDVNLLETPDFFSWIVYPKGRVLTSLFSLIGHPILLFFFIKNLLWGVIHHSMAQARQRLWRDCINYLPLLDGEYDEAYDFSGNMRRYVLEKVNATTKHTWIHSDYKVFGLDKQIDKYLLQRFNRIHCVSDTCKAIFDSEFPELSSLSDVFLNIVDMSFIKSQLSGPGFSDSFKGVRLLDVTRIDPNKGLDIAVQVCRKLKDMNLNFKWYILGNDPLGYQSELERLIHEYGVEDCFILEGFTANPYPYMNEADIIVHFSRFEGRSVAIDEALALHKTVLLTNYPTAKDQITHGVNGFICDFDIEELSYTLKKVITNYAY